MDLYQLRERNAQDVAMAKAIQAAAPEQAFALCVRVLETDPANCGAAELVARVLSNAKGDDVKDIVLRDLPTASRQVVCTQVRRLSTDLGRRPPPILALLDGLCRYGGEVASVAAFKAEELARSEERTTRDMCQLQAVVSEQWGVITELRRRLQKLEAAGDQLPRGALILWSRLRIKGVPAGWTAACDSGYYKKGSPEESGVFWDSDAGETVCLKKASPGDIMVRVEQAPFATIFVSASRSVHDVKKLYLDGARQRQQGSAVDPAEVKFRYNGEDLDDSLSLQAQLVPHGARIDVCYLEGASWREGASLSSARVTRSITDTRAPRGQHALKY